MVSVAIGAMQWFLPPGRATQWNSPSDMKLSNIFEGVLKSDEVGSTAQSYEHVYSGADTENQKRRKVNYKGLTNQYYDLVTDLFEYGWGQSFHFAPRAPNESFAASLARHEHYIAHRLALRPGMRVADLGCGVGGPLREIARFSGATIIGVNNNAYQLERARKLTDEAGLGQLAEFLKCDFMDMNLPDNSLDAVYAIEATVHAPNMADCYGEVLRVIKPGGFFAAYEYCLTNRYDPDNPEHLQIKRDIEVGGALPEIYRPHEIDEALRQAGFELLETRDLAENPGPGIPWYQPLAGSRFSVARLRSSNSGRLITHGTLQLLQMLRVVPKGTVQVSNLLNLCARALVNAGSLGIFTPMYFLYARKPE